jgi:hypothetical protein
MAVVAGKVWVAIANLTFSIHAAFAIDTIAAIAITTGLVGVAVAHLTLMCGTIAFFAVFRLALSNTLAAAAFLIWVAAANLTASIHAAFAFKAVTAVSITAGFSVRVAAVTTAAILSVRTGFSISVPATVLRAGIITRFIITARTGATGIITAGGTAAATPSTAAVRIA